MIDYLISITNVQQIFSFIVSCENDKDCDTTSCEFCASDGTCRGSDEDFCDNFQCGLGDGDCDAEQCGSDLPGGRPPPLVCGENNFLTGKTIS